MDADRFDDFLRFLAAMPTRRGFVHALTGLTLGGTVGSLPGPAAEAKRKRKRKKKKKKHKPQCQGGMKPCGEACIPSADCCADTDCSEGQRCTSGACACPSGTLDCEGACIEGECCGDDECPSGKFCEQSDFSCTCPAELFACGETCCNPGDACLDDVCGACPVRDICDGGDPIECGVDCECATSIDEATECAHFPEGDCIACESDTDCVTALTQPAICVPLGEFCNCPGITTGFCMLIGCPSQSDD